MRTLVIGANGKIGRLFCRKAVEQGLAVRALRAERPLEGPPAIRHYRVAKKLADERLRASRVSHTILRPGRLSDEPASGRVRSDPAAGRGMEISRENVALCVLASLRQPGARGHSIDLLDGEQPIEDLFAALSTGRRRRSPASPSPGRD